MLSKYKYVTLIAVVMIVCSAGTFFYTCKPVTTTQTRQTEKKTEPDSTVIYISFGGDVMGHGPQIRAAWDTASKTYNYDPCFVHLKPFLDTIDYAVANLELTFAGEPYGGYPQFSSPDALGNALQHAGFDFLITANNHSVDRGRKGIERTIKVLDSLGIPHTGTFIDSAAKAKTYPHIVTIKGIRIAILNYTYGTNGIPVPYPNIVNLIDTVQMAADLAAAKALKPDLILTTLHWGEEYQRKQSKQQEQLAHWLAEKGSDAIIGMHPHVIQPYEEYVTSSGKKVPVYYSLGNFISNQRERYKDGGIMAGLTLVKNKSGAYVFAADYLPFWVCKWDFEVKFEIIPVSAYEADSAKFKLEAKDDLSLKQFAVDTRELLKNIKVR